MSGNCDRCAERTSQIINIANIRELAAATRLGYRNICPACYDDLLAESADAETNEEDRRSEPRVRVSIKARVEGNTSHMDPFVDDVTIDEISASGLRLRSPREIDPGTILKLSVPDYEFETNALVQVVWRDAGERWFGLKLIEPNDGWERLWNDHSE
ncbi:MAG TPA: PilZ domain-containing protein [Blastocatellia bacterium]|nr:PilZ domain-containing protein [Blastocatellia bacterium]